MKFIYVFWFNFLLSSVKFVSYFDNRKQKEAINFFVFLYPGIFSIMADHGGKYQHILISQR